MDRDVLITIDIADSQHRIQASRFSSTFTSMDDPDFALSLLHELRNETHTAYMDDFGIG